MTGYVARFSKDDRLWTVGYFLPSGEWHAVSDHDNQDEAERKVCMLNGGTALEDEDDDDALTRTTIENLNQLVSLRTQAARRAEAGLVQVTRALKELLDTTEVKNPRKLPANFSEQALEARRRAREVLAVYAGSILLPEKPEGG